MAFLTFHGLPESISFGVANLLTLFQQSLLYSVAARGIKGF
jgi:hypothetical protein